MIRTIATLFACAFIGFGGVLTGWDTATAQEADALEQVLERGVLRVAVYRDFPPYSYRKDGRYVGLDVDVARALATHLGVGLDLMRLVADENMGDDLRNAVWKGHYLGGGVADTMMHVPFDPEFAEENDRAVLFAPYFREQMAIAFDPEQVGDVSDPVALAEHKIGAELDTIADFYLSSAFSGVFRDSGVRFRNIEDAITAFGNGELAAVLAPRAQLEGLLHGTDPESYRISLYTIRGMPRSYWDIGLAVKQGNDTLKQTLEQAMTELRADGSLQTIADNHGVTYVAPVKPATN
jgi:ABC-type amino acid transport substrate-binding protein